MPIRHGVGGGSQTLNPSRPGSRPFRSRSAKSRSRGEIAFTGRNRVHGATSRRVNCCVRTGMPQLPDGKSVASGDRDSVTAASVSDRLLYSTLR